MPPHPQCDDPHMCVCVCVQLIACVIHSTHLSQRFVENIQKKLHTPTHRQREQSMQHRRPVPSLIVGVQITHTHIQTEKHTHKQCKKIEKKKRENNTYTSLEMAEEIQI